MKLTFTLRAKNIISGFWEMETNIDTEYVPVIKV